jgi:hypothetical protein
VGDLCIGRGTRNTEFSDEVAAFPSGAHDDRSMRSRGHTRTSLETERVPIVMTTLVGIKRALAA